VCFFEALYVFVCDLNIFTVFIALIGEHHDLNITSRVLLNFREPTIDAEETLLVRQVTHYNDSISSFVICISDGSVSLLSRSVPNLKFDSRLIDLKGSKSLQVKNFVMKLCHYLQSQLQLYKCSFPGSNRPTHYLD